MNEAPPARENADNHDIPNAEDTLIVNREPQADENPQPE